MTGKAWNFLVLVQDEVLSVVQVFHSVKIVTCERKGFPHQTEVNQLNGTMISGASGLRFNPG